MMRFRAMCRFAVVGPDLPLLIFDRYQGKR